MSAIELTFLRASNGRRMTKTFYKDDQPEPYPMVREFHSTAVEVNSLGEFHEAVFLMAKEGQCLLRGSLKKPLRNESRAGLMVPNCPSSWLVLDFDRDRGFASVDDLLEAIDPGLANVSYVFQHSASAGVVRKAQVQGHVFLLLEQPVPPTVMKEWVRKINLVTPGLTALAKLSRTGVAVNYALDITVNQPDKLIYIAPPRCVGVENKLSDSDRIILVEKKIERWDFKPAVSFEWVKQQEQTLLNKLRDAGGLPAYKPRLVSVGPHRVLSSVSAAAVTGIKPDERFTRLNLNGGDSWAYWHHKEFHQDLLLFSFKDDSVCYLRDIAPEYFNSLAEESSKASTQDMGADSIEPFAIRDRSSDRYYAGLRDKENGRIVSVNAIGTKDKLGDFMTQYGAPRPRTVDTWNVVYDPINVRPAMDLTKRELNLYKPSIYAKEENRKEGSWTLIESIIRHVCVDKETYDRFINWLAYIAQTRYKTGTAWLFSGTYGTGKGLTFNRIIRPLIGPSNAVSITINQLEERYNLWAGQSSVVLLDEGNIKSSKDAEKMQELLKNYITEPSIQIRGMYAAPIELPSYMNLIIALNDPHGLNIFDNDRRYNIAPRQDTPLLLPDTADEQITAELPAFAYHIHAYPANAMDAKTVLHNAARQELIASSMTVSEAFFKAIRMGDLQWMMEAFIDGRSSNPPVAVLKKVSLSLSAWLNDARESQNTHATMQQLMDVYQFVSAKEAPSARKFAWLCNINGVHKNPIRKWVDGELCTVYTITWVAPPKEYYRVRLDYSSKPSPVPLQLVASPS